MAAYRPLLVVQEIRVILLKSLTRSVFGIVGKVIYPGVWKMDAGVSQVVE